MGLDVREPSQAEPALRFMRRDGQSIRVPRQSSLRAWVLLGLMVFLTSGESFGQESPVSKANDDKEKSTLPASPTNPAEIRKLAEERAAREAARKRGDITFDDLKFDIEKGAKFKKEMITKDLLELDKKVLRIRGYILPTSVFQQDGIKQFVLVRDNQECCFGPGAMLYDCIIIQMEEGKTTKFTTRPIAIRGKFELDSETYKYPDGTNFAVYKMTATEVK